MSDVPVRIRELFRYFLRIIWNETPSDNYIHSYYYNDFDYYESMQFELFKEYAYRKYGKPDMDDWYMELYHGFKDFGMKGCPCDSPDAVRIYLDLLGK